MFNERMQILISREQRRRLEAAARARGTSVASLVREAIDERFGGVGPDERRRAVDRIRARRGEYIEPEELRELLEDRYDREYG